MEFKTEESQILLDLRKHREELYEKTKNLSPKAIAELITQEGEKFLKTYNLNLPRREDQKRMSHKGKSNR
jgi:hypothetical protein